MGGLFLHDGCGFELLGSGVRSLAPLRRVPTTWFEGPLIPLPESQQKEDYPQDSATQLEVAADAPLGTCYFRLSTSQGTTGAQRFIVGDLPEVVEQEIDGEPLPVAVTLPVTINGRIFPREDVDVWSFKAAKGQAIWAEVCATRLGSPLEARLEVIDAAGRKLAEDIGNPAGEANLSFTAPADGVYQLRIHDINFGGLQNYVYRLTVSAGPHVSAVFPLGARRGQSTRFELIGSGLPAEAAEATLPAAGDSTIAQRFVIGGQPTNPVLIELDDLAEHVEREPNNDAGHAESVGLPAVVNGRIQTPGDADCFAIALAKDQTYDFDLRASRLGSPLDSVLTILDPAGKELRARTTWRQATPIRSAV